MLKYLNWPPNIAEHGNPLPALAALYVEIELPGTALREIGVNAKGEVIHKFPSKRLYGTYGFFNLGLPKVMSPSLRDDISPEEFERLWNSTP